MHSSSPLLAGFTCLVMCLVTVFIGGCAGDAMTAALPERRASELSLPLSGAYDLTVQAPFSGALTARFTAVPTKDGFEARSREGVAWPMIGGMVRFFGPLFTPAVFPRGVVFVWKSRLPSDEGPGEGWIGVAGIPTLGARTRLYSADQPIEILSREGRRAAILMLRPVVPGATPATDYGVLASEIRRAVETDLFDDSAARSGAVDAYGRRLEDVARMSRDDAEFVFGAVLAARAYLRFSMPVMWRSVDADGARLFAEWSERERSTVRALFDDRTKTAVLRADAFFAPEDVDRAMRAIVARTPDGLILDLRTCPGVTLSSLLVLSWLCEEPTEAGVFFGSSRREEVLSGRAADLPTVRVRDAESVRELERTLARHGAARVIVEPREEGFRGPAHVLTGVRTTTSCEPLVWLLKSTGRAPSVGQTTGGKPWISKPVDVGQGWTLWLAGYDYVPPAGLGARFNGRGIRPDVPVKDALGEARRRLNRGAKGSSGATSAGG